MASTIMEEMVANDIPVTTATYDAAVKVKSTAVLIGGSTAVQHPQPP